MTYQKNIVAACLLMISSVFAAAPEISLDVRAFVNGTAPGTSGALFAGMFVDSLGVNANGEVAFFGWLRTNTGDVDSSNITGVWVPDGTGGLTPIRASDPAPGTGENFEPSVFSVSLNDLGHVAVRGSLPSNRDGIWGPTLSDPFGLIVLEQTNSPAGSGVFLQVGDPMLDNGDHVAFIGILETGTNRVTADDNTGLWAGGTIGSPQLLAREGSPAPGTTGVFESFFEPGSDLFYYEGQNRLAFAGNLRQGVGGVTASDDMAIWMIDDLGILTLVAREGSAAQGTNGVFENFTSIMMDDAGTLAILATLRVGVGTVTTDDDQGIWVSDGMGVLQRRVRKGESAPGTTGVFDQLFTPHVNGDAFAFTGFLRIGVGGVTVADSAGVWRGMAAGPLELAVRASFTETEIPIVPSTVLSVNLIGVMEGGEIVYWAYFGSQGFTDIEGLFLVDSAGNRVPIVYSGQSIEVAPGDFQLMESLGIFSLSPQWSPRVNESGQIGFGFNLPSRQGAVIVASIITATGPAPAPDGQNGTTPLRADRLDTFGNDAIVTWDVSSCEATEYNLIYGDLVNVGTYGLSGSQCSIGNSGSFLWNGLPPGDLYFLVVGDDGADCESSWGTDSGGAERNGPNSSLECASTCKDLTGSCL